MCLIFTDEFIKSINTCANPFERHYIELLAEKPELSWIRDKIENIMNEYPYEKRDDMIKLIRSSNDIECRARINELYVYNNLINNFSDVKVEPILSIANNKTPDFWVDQSIAFEVASIFEQVNPHNYSIIETLNSIKSEMKIHLNHIENLPEHGSPKLREIKRYFNNLFEQKKNIDKFEKFQYTSSQGISISGWLYKGRIEYSTVGSIMSGIGFDKDEPNYKNTVRKVIKKKLSKYKGISEAGFPIVVVLYNINDWIDKQDFDEVFFGDVKICINSEKRIIESREGNGIFSYSKNTSLSAVLIKDYATENEYYLVENPYARIPLGEKKDIIISAFNTKKL